jgi:hypothetical protein
MTYKTTIVVWRLLGTNSSFDVIKDPKKARLFVWEEQRRAIRMYN